MNFQQLVERIQRLVPDADLREASRVGLLLTNAIDHPQLLDDEELESNWRDIRLKLQLATDQHAAVTEELERLAESDPAKFDKEQIWILIRAIKVQSQILEFYLGEPALDI